MRFIHTAIINNKWIDKSTKFSHNDSHVKKVFDKEWFYSTVTKLRKRLSFEFSYILFHT